MNDEDKYIDIETSDDDDDEFDYEEAVAKSGGGKGRRRREGRTGLQFANEVERRAHHNELERKRRSVLKNRYDSLRDTMPSLRGNNSASRGTILREAKKQIKYLKGKFGNCHIGVPELEKQNTILKAKILALEKPRRAGNYRT